ncbi:MAG: plasmid replication initiation protein [Oleiphilaceae bacterium]|jgi:plasmid replication initiation protein
MVDEVVIFEQTSLIEESKLLVYKRNELIHAKFDLSAFSQKIMIALIARINPRLDELPEFEFSLSELAHILGVSRQRIENCVDDFTTELQSQVAKLAVRDKIREKQVKDEIKKARDENRPPDNFIYEKSKSFDKINWFDVSSYREGESIVRFKFDKRMESYLLDFNSNFTKYSLPYVLKMESKYSIRLYEIFRSFLSLKLVEGGQTDVFRTVNVSDLREMLGIKPSAFKRFYDFERTVLKQAKKELDNTDLSFSYNFPERKVPNSRKKVTKIKFRVYCQKIEMITDNWQDTLKLWVSEKRYLSLVSTYDRDRIQRNVELVCNQLNDGREINNLVAYVNSAIKLDYADTDKALDPFTYTDKKQREFVKQIVVPNWHSLSKLDQENFILYRFNKGVVADNFNQFKAESGQRSISDALMDIHDTDW